MRGLFGAFGTGVIFVIALLGTGVVLFFYHGTQLESEAPDYLSQAIPAIVANWDPEELYNRATPEFKQVTSDDQLRDLFNKLRPLGSLVRYDGAVGSAGWNYADGKTTVNGSYVARVEFTNGNAAFTVHLAKTDDEWHIKFFQVDATFKAKPAQGT